HRVEAAQEGEAGAGVAVGVGGDPADGGAGAGALADEPAADLRHHRHHHRVAEDGDLRARLQAHLRGVEVDGQLVGDAQLGVGLEGGELRLARGGGVGSAADGRGGGGLLLVDEPHGHAHVGASRGQRHGGEAVPGRPRDDAPRRHRGHREDHCDHQRTCNHWRPSWKGRIVSSSSMARTNHSLKPEADSDEKGIELSLRPRTFGEYIGQTEVVEKLKVYVQAAKKREEALDHCLFSGPPGLGKTSLAHIIAAELGVGLHVTSGPAIEKKGDLAGLLTNVNERDVLFIDEIHRLQAAVEEYLYPAMEDYRLDVTIDSGAAARAMKIDLPPFTLIGATTRTGLLTSPLRDRFQIQERLEHYEPRFLEQILERSARILKVRLDPAGGAEIARRSRGTPRIANRLLRRVRDFAEVEGNGQVTKELASKALDR